MICQRVHYHGRVQGVGFRYTARSIAQGFAVAGTVRNEADGSVKLVVQGERGQVEAFLAALAQRMAGNIERAEIHDELLGDFVDFRILH